MDGEKVFGEGVKSREKNIGGEEGDPNKRIGFSWGLWWWSSF